MSTFSSSSVSVDPPAEKHRYSTKRTARRFGSGLLKILGGLLSVLCSLRGCLRPFDVRCRL